MGQTSLSWRNSIFPVFVLAAVFFLTQLPAPEKESQPAIEVESAVLPAAGFQSKVSLADAAVKLVAAGVIVPAKFEELYAARGGLPPELKDVLRAPQAAPIKLTRDNVGVYLNLLWPLGLANKLAINEEGPLNGDMLYNFASTGGWTLGQKENGGAYFNQFEIVKLTPAQEALVLRVAENIFRPCCDNSTFFQDCNHGSAMFGLLQLGAAQGLSEEELYREALAFNSFWFPKNYLEMATYFKAVKKTDWSQVDSKLALSRDYSSASGWSKNVAQELRRLELVNDEGGGASCGV